MLELGVGRTAVPGLLLGQGGAGALAAMRVDHDSLRDRQHPRSEVSGIPKRGVAAQRPEERLLEGILGTLPPQSAHQESEDDVTGVLVEALERRQGHVVHHEA